ncbi:MAG: DUF1641 domain-containing protein, partial [Acidilobus sp.]
LMRVDADELSNAQNNVADISHCAAKSMGAIDLTEERRLGMLGAADKLMDPDVQTTLWALLELAKALGRCLRQRS